jgi:hypothetical protein
MAHQINITLTDNEYDALSAKTGKDDKALEELLHELLTHHLQAPSSPKRPPTTSRDISLCLYRQGLIEHIPEGRVDTPEEAAERRRLAELFGQVEPGGKLASEMVIEDRGPRDLLGPAQGS